MPNNNPNAEVSMQELAKHNTADNAWIAISGW